MRHRLGQRAVLETELLDLGRHHARAPSLELEEPADHGDMDLKPPGPARDPTESPHVSSAEETNDRIQ